MIAAGVRIRYRISLHGLPLGWTTEIRRWEPPHRFVDVQLRGPYRLWHHTHRFEARDGGTEITDTVRYRLPFGMLGRLMNRVVVRGDVERIFDYRIERIRALFGGPQAAR
jgi:ligand-binding SRPBCC domain-containing protein